ncbi:MAG TPA: exosortase system-associated protein, TIGR04073 family [Verrucomicrobiae bacterium]|nr:exosortase system-associated protein, TIGR04073 family [Verrucomicrobiae bacterium]
MRRAAAAVLFIFLLAPLAHANDQQRPDSIIEKMAQKLVRGVTNVVTSPAELAKQTVVTVNSMGAPGIIIGPLKGIGMTAYRAFIGATETVFFLVPAPGYYDPMIDPAYVWQE